jgi:hypothetical protein
LSEQIDAFLQICADRHDQQTKLRKVWFPSHAAQVGVASALAKPAASCPGTAHIAAYQRRAFRIAGAGRTEIARPGVERQRRAELLARLSW